MSTASIIAEPSKRLRAAPAKGSKPRVVRDGGDYGAGVIYGASFVAEGEALGHRLWLDTQFVKSVNDAVNASGERGKKMRFTHPSLSGDGMGSFLGRGKNSRIEDGKAIGDIHFSKSSHKTPDGDLATYVMDMADEDPDAFGVSIVFSSDIGAEDRFVADNTDKDGNFKSPDKDNAKQYRHARLARLHAADVVDDPAANPDGLFRREQLIADEADRLCAFALGISDERPQLRNLSVDPDRTAAFVARFLDSHGLELKERTMSDPKKDAAPAPITQESLDATLKTFGEGLLAKVDEKVASLATKPKEGDEPTPEDLRKEGAKRASEIMAFAATSGLNDHAKIAQEAIDAGQSVEAFKAGLADRLIAQNKLSKDDGNGDGADKDPHAAFRAEFRANQQQFANLGIDDEDAYVRSRCRDEGLPVPAIKKAG